MSSTPLQQTIRRQIVQLVDARNEGDPARRARFRAFVDAVLDRVRGPFLAQHDAVTSVALLEAAFAFIERRTVDEVRVEIRPHGGQALTLSNMPDQSFIVDTIRLFFRYAAAEYVTGFNVVIPVSRGDDGALIGVGDGEAESVVLQLTHQGRLLDDDHAADLLRLHLDLSRALVTDFRAMTSEIERVRSHFGAEHETGEFLHWLLQENFVFMGMVTEGARLGIERIPSPYAGDAGGDWPAGHGPGHIQVRKSAAESPVHRAGRLDEVLITGPTGERLLVRGLFTLRATTQPSRQVPLLRDVLLEIHAAEANAVGGFRYKGLSNVFDALPTEFLLATPVAAIAPLLGSVFDSELHQEVGVHFVPTGPSSVFALIAMPKERYSEELRKAVEAEVLSSLRPVTHEHGVFLGRFETVLVNYWLQGVSMPEAELAGVLTAQLRAVATPWNERLWQVVRDAHDESKADAVMQSWSEAFAETYKTTTPASRAWTDIQMFEDLGLRKSVSCDIWKDESGIRLSLFQARDVFLTTIVPVLDNFGLVVVGNYATPVNPTGREVYLDTFRLEETTEIAHTQILLHRAALVEAIDAAFAGHIENDRLNQLVLTAGLTWWEVDVLRGLSRYLRQLGVKLSLLRIREILLAHSDVAGHLVDLFRARFDPELDGDRDAQVAAARTVVEAGLRRMRTHDEDTLFGGLFGLMMAMVRTNAWRTDRLGHYISFKFDGSKVKEMGVRRPMFEIFVHSRDVEGVHLRFGKVARGGLRWSDRDDFRTEVLGLVTTQQVKNVVIVPEGAKGGFYLKRPSRDPAVRRQEADELYKTFIRGLLDLTDNGRDGQVTKPPRVLCHDGDDPYLVVAADKGTAHLSDTANQLSLQYGHWLGDAFASGGSNGYDHKKVGITARGGWVLVKRHFAELGKDAYSEPFTCVGIGDMSGDVFGNGLIETPFAKLLGAFNHLHVFLDPNPDPKVTFDERMRLFKAERKGGWENYDRSLISQGGGIYERSAKAIPLTPEVQSMLGLTDDEASPDEVIRALLKMDVDLLWNGGIGTYIKASFETDAEVDDRSNDALRVDGATLGAKIVGEGGNLGCTQRARIEAALRGVKLNTDAIDNSGGVDLSDHEVNLKILLDRVVSRGDLTLEARNTLLAEMTDEVADLVLANNDAQGRQISRDEVRSRADLFPFAQAIAFVESRMHQRRELLALPNEEELQRRSKAGLGLTRPELAVLSAWVKMFVFRELLAHDARALPGFDRLLVEYFPKTIQQRYPDDVRNHMLAREIAMTVATTRLVGDVGAAWFPLVAETSGRSVLDIATAYLKAQTAVGLEPFRAELEAARVGTAALASYRAWVRLDASVREVAAGFLTKAGGVPDDATLDRARGIASRVVANLGAEARGADVERRAQMLRDGVSSSVASVILDAQYVALALTVDAEARRLNVAVDALVVRWLAVSRASRLGAVLDELARRPATGRWDPLAQDLLQKRLSAALSALVEKTPVRANRPVDDLVAELQVGALAGVRRVCDELLGPAGANGRAASPPSLAGLVVLEDRIRTA